MIGRGIQVYIGIDPIVSMTGDATLSMGLVRHLQDRNLFIINLVAKETRPSDNWWVSAWELHLSDGWELEWENYITNLTMVGINLLDSSDHIVWCRNEKLGDVTASLAYEVLA